VIRDPYVAGSFYPASRRTLQWLVEQLYEQVARSQRPAARPAQPVLSLAGEPSTPLRGILVPHAGLEWSGAVAAAGWRALAEATAVGSDDNGHTTVVILGTNHSARLDGVGVWAEGTWRTPLGDVAVDQAVGDAIVRLGSPFEANAATHLREHSIEVQLPLLQTISPGTRIVPIAVSAGTGSAAVAAGERLGHLIEDLDADHQRVLVAISSDLAHYPAHRDCEQVTTDLLPSLLGLDPESVASIEAGQRNAGVPGLVCGMCGIEPTVLGLAAIRAMGATRGVALASATSADAGGPADRTVGYLAAAFG
jgi:MEMO1 family protein